MKRRIFLLTAILGAATLVALTGCGSKPVDELKMARTAMEQARDKEAQEYEPIEWDRARWQWEEANALIQMSRYGEARGVLLQAVASFNEAGDKAKRRVESLQIEINALKASNEIALKNLEREAGNPKAKPSIRNGIDRSIPLIEEKISVMNAAYNAKEYLRARMAGQEALRHAQALQERMAATS